MLIFNCEYCFPMACFVNFKDDIADTAVLNYYMLYYTNSVASHIKVLLHCITFNHTA